MAPWESISIVCQCLVLVCSYKQGSAAELESWSISYNRVIFAFTHCVVLISQRFLLFDTIIMSLQMFSVVVVVIIIMTIVYL